MAANKSTEEAVSETSSLIDIALLKNKKRTKDSVFCGVCAAEDWRPGKSVSESDYDTAVEKFLKNQAGKAGR